MINPNKKHLVQGTVIGLIKLGPNKGYLKLDVNGHCLESKLMLLSEVNKYTIGQKVRGQASYSILNDGYLIDLGHKR